MRKYIVGMLLPLFLCTGCEQSKLKHLAEEEIGPYVRRFKTEAKKYGKNFDNVSIDYRFGELDNDKAGICDMSTSDPVEVRFDLEYWNTLTGPNADNMKENLVFHELGHGLCRRYHDNKVLANGDWKSIMCGDELPDGRGPSINYRGMRKAYYRRELFTQTKDVPDWSTMVPDFTEVHEHLVFPHTVNDVTIDYSTMFSGDMIKMGVLCERQEGYCTAKELQNTSSYVGILLANWHSESDFYLECDMSYEGAGDFGLMVGHMGGDTLQYNAHYLLVSNDGYVNIGEGSCHYSFIELYREEVKTGSVKLGLRRQGDMFYYYINDEFVYFNDLEELPEGGGHVVFPIPARGKLTMRSLNIYLPDTEMRASGPKLSVQPVGTITLPERKVRP